MIAEVRRRAAFRQAADKLCAMIHSSTHTPTLADLQSAVQDLLRATVALERSIDEQQPTEPTRTWLCECCGELRPTSISASSAHGLHDRWVCFECKKYHGYWPTAHGDED